MSNRPAWMRRALEERRSTLEPEAGFTLIELMVVLLILAILLAIAIPLFLGLIGGAGDRSAQSDATNALKESLSVYEGPGNQSWSAQSTSPSGFSTAAPEFAWSNDSAGSGTNLASSTAPGNGVSYWVGDAAAANDSQALVLATYSKSTHTCWYVAQLEAKPAGSSIGAQAFVSKMGAKTQGTFYAQQSQATDCQASVSIDPFDWGPSWAAAAPNPAGTTTSTTSSLATASPTCTGTGASALSGATATQSGSNVNVTLTDSGGSLPVTGTVALYANGSFVTVTPAGSHTSVTFTGIAESSLTAGSVRIPMDRWLVLLQRGHRQLALSETDAVREASGPHRPGPGPFRGPGSGRILRAPATFFGAAEPNGEQLPARPPDRHPAGARPADSASSATAAADWSSTPWTPAGPSR